MTRELTRSSAEVSGSLRTAIALLTLGAFALGAALVSEPFSVRVMGWLLAIGGILRGASALARVGDRHRVRAAEAITGAVYLAVGAMLSWGSPARAMPSTVVLLAAALFALAGVIRIVASRASREPGWRFRAAHGLLSLVLGSAVWAQWPLSGLSALGRFTAIDMIAGGFATAARALPPPAEHTAHTG
jgi:uncharacterized membrane protein HdeD (DUF308 family)